MRRAPEPLPLLANCFRQNTAMLRLPADRRAIARADRSDRESPLQVRRGRASADHSSGISASLDVPAQAFLWPINRLPLPGGVAGRRDARDDVLPLRRRRLGFERAAPMRPDRAGVI